MAISAAWIEKQWGIANAEGRGRPVGDDSDTPDEAARRIGLTDIRTISTHDGGMVAGLDADGCLIAIADSYGPWAAYIAGITADQWREGSLEADN